MWLLFFVVFKKQYDYSETIALKQTKESKSAVVSENSNDFWQTILEKRFFEEAVFGKRVWGGGLGKAVWSTILEKRFKCNGKIVFLIAGVAARGQYFERNFLVDHIVAPSVQGDGFLVIEGNVAVLQKEHCRVCRCRF